jgi:hypothetical protein
MSLTIRGDAFARTASMVLVDDDLALPRAGVDLPPAYHRENEAYPLVVSRFATAPVLMQINDGRCVGQFYAQRWTSRISGHSPKRRLLS